MPLTRLLAILLTGALLAPLAYADSAENASRYYEDALKRYERKDDAGAIIQLKNALKEDNRMLQALVLLGQAYLRKGEPAAAERVLADAEKLGAARSQIAALQAQALYDQGKYRILLEKIGPDGLPAAPRLEVLIYRARAHIELTQLDAAMSAANKAAQTPGGEMRALVLQSRIHLNAGRSEDARRAVELALQRAPGDAEALTMRASIAHAHGKLESALRDYSQALVSQPRYVDARIARAGILLDLKRDSEARTDIDYLQQNAPSDPRGAYLRAVYYSRIGDTARERAAMQDVARTLSQLAPEFVDGSDQLLFLGGLAHHALGEYERAKTYLGRYLEKHPRATGARKLMASILLAERQYTRAIAMLQPALQASPGDTKVMTMLGEAYMAMGNHGKATSLFQEAANTRNSAEVQTGLGISLLSAGQHEAGFDALQRAYQASASRQTGVPLALALLKRGEAKQAVAIVEVIVKNEPSNISARNLLGVARLAAGDRAGARAAYVAAIKMAPNFYVAHLNLARLDEADGKMTVARQRYLGILKAAPNHMDAMLELARLEESTGRVAEAIQLLDKARNQRAQDIRPYLALYALYMRQGQPRQALDAARNAQATAPDNPAALMAMADAQIALGMSDQSRGLLHRLTKIVAFDPARLTQVAVRQIRIGDYESARYTIGKAQLADAGFLPARLVQVRLETQSGNLVEAEKLASALLAQTGSRGEAQKLIGEIRMAQKRYPEAVAAYRAAHAASPDSDSLFGLYGALMAASQPRDAAALMSQWRQSYPDDRAAGHALGEAWLVLKDYPRARSVYQALVASDAKDARAHNNLAQVQLQLQDLPAALKHAEQARTLAPNQPQVNDTLGWVLVQQGQFEKGLRYLREASLRAPDDPQIQAHLQQTLSRMGR